MMVLLTIGKLGGKELRAWDNVSKAMNCVVAISGIPAGSLDGDGGIVVDEDPKGLVGLPPRHSMRGLLVHCSNELSGGEHFNFNSLGHRRRHLPPKQVCPAPYCRICWRRSAAQQAELRDAQPSSL